MRVYRFENPIEESLDPRPKRTRRRFPFRWVLIALVVVAFRVFPGSYGLYAAAILIGALSAENLNSIERYGLSAFPLLMALAVISRPPQVERAVMAVLGGGVVALSAMAWLGAYVP